MALALMGVFVAPMISAQEGAPLAPEEQAFSLYQEAAEDFKGRDFSAAVRKLEEAYALFPKAIILIKLAEGLEHLGRIEEAQARFAEVEPEDEEMRQRVESSLRRLSVQLSRPVSVSILTPGVSDVRVVLDGIDIRKTAPLVTEVPRGRHILQLFKPGYEVFVLDPFYVSGAATVVVEAKLRELLYPLAFRVGSARPEEAYVELNGTPFELQASDRAGVGVLMLPAGDYEVLCRVGANEVRGVVEVSGEGASSASCLPSQGSDAVIGWTMVAAGSALFAGGAALLAWHAVDVGFAKRNNLVIEHEAIPNRDVWGPVLMGVGLGTGLLSLLFLLEDEGEPMPLIQPAWLPNQSGSTWGVSARF